ncbi:RNA polymerase sigma-70 factor (sigma-E family) [Kineococcus xinjiangensis]|uniref:RNA polymerase sigma-70 factor (Sigma-E family) n=1 Tax=Kineococcus xinjiangensis TaxID=512762 RepID=A0A2S6IHT7_9ACTN|nr:SigE family RNA polymerase sigma factor [Kineococcus xinjiangensis]PPK93783.1 RNA polymerase sigma-70 factor (sigma-E family) [Kineococcus xinjiangensis]
MRARDRLAATGADGGPDPAPRRPSGRTAVPGVWDLESLVAWKGPQLVRLARALLRDPHQAEDVVQDVLATCVRKWSRIQSVDDPSAYLNRMVVNAVTSLRRRAWRREWLSDPAELPEVHLDDSSSGHAERQRCLALLRRLPDRQRIALVLRLYEDMPDEEIADLLGCSTGTVRSNAHRGLATLRRLIAEEDPRA